MPWVFLNPLEKQTFTRVDRKDYNDYISCLRKYRYLNIDSERESLLCFFVCLFLHLRDLYREMRRGRKVQS